MPKSRRRPGSRKRRPKRKFGMRTAVSKFFEEIGLNPEKDLPHAVLYHYTSTFGALKILESQKFWATAHDCTNDPGELVSATATLIEVAQTQRRNENGLAAHVLNLFLADYHAEMIANVRTAYLCCFSIARDDKTQWEQYGGNGEGICLGLRIINESQPESRKVFSRLNKVVYYEASLRKWFSDILGKTCSALHGYPLSDQNLRFALATLRGLAAFASIMTKTSDWSSEQEVRHVTMDRLEPGVQPSVRISAEGKKIRYLPITLRAHGRLIALDEIIVGAKQDFEEVRKQFEAMLTSKGYVLGSIEYPRITASSG